MKVKGRDIWDGMGAINALMMVRLAPPAAWTMTRVRKCVKTEYEAIEETRHRLLEQHGAFAPEGAVEYEFPEGKLKEFEWAWNEVLETEIELPFGDGIKFAEMGLADPVAPLVLEQVEWLFMPEKPKPETPKENPNQGG